MAFKDQTPASGLVALVLLAIVLSVIGRAIYAGGFENFFIPGKAEENAVMEKLADYPGNAVFMEELEASFPDAYDDLSKALGRAARGPGGEDRVVIAGQAWMNGFFANHARDFAGAPIDRLDRVMELEQEFLGNLRDHDEYACAAYAKGEPFEAPLPEAFDELSGEISSARIAAIRGGRSDQQLRLKLNPGHWQALDDTLRARGLNDEQVSVLFGAAEPGSIGAPLACEMAIELVSAIREQPEEPRALLTSVYVSGVQ